MTRPRLLRWLPFVVIAFVMTIATSAQTAGNTVATTKAEDDSRTAAPNDLKPTECTAITLTAKRSGSGTINGASTAELITGSSGVDTISASGGDDCVLGGAGNDSLTGGAGVDVCIGGDGTDTFNSSCETQIQ